MIDRSKFTSEKPLKGVIEPLHLTAVGQGPSLDCTQPGGLGFRWVGWGFLGHIHLIA